MWSKSWRIADDAAERPGGQGTVTKVVSLADGLPGALKELHEKNERIKARRFRMQQEALALKALDGNGTPLLLDSNVDQWENKEVPLFVVMEWIDGPSIEEACSGRPFQLDHALEVTQAILSTVENCHEISIFHRDLKHDNVILRGSSETSPVLVDFGAAWVRPSETETIEYASLKGTDFQNRFLRLPEYAPGRNARDSRSDLALVVGLLFFMLTGRAPRDLFDEKDKMPHQRDLEWFPNALQQDLRWDRLTRLFGVGFQNDIDLRFQDTEMLRRYLSGLDPVLDKNPPAELEDELAAIADLVRAKPIQNREASLSTMQAGNQRFHQRLQQLLSTKNIDFRGPNPQIAHGENVIHQERRIRSSELSTSPVARYQHYLKIEAGIVVAKATAEKGPLEEYYRGPISDSDSLFEAAEARASSLAIELLSILRGRLSQLAN